MFYSTSTKQNKKIIKKLKGMKRVAFEVGIVESENRYFDEYKSWEIYLIYSIALIYIVAITVYTFAAGMILGVNETEIAILRLLVVFTENNKKRIIKQY